MTGSLAGMRNRKKIRVAGLVLVRQRPESAKGITFLTLEDETGIANLVVWPALYERFRRVVIGSRLLGCSGHVQREDKVIHVVAESLENLSHWLGAIGDRDEPLHLPPGRGDEALSSSTDHRIPGTKPALRIRSRDFH